MQKNGKNIDSRYAKHIYQVTGLRELKGDLT